MDQVTALRLQTPTSTYFQLPWYGAPEDAKYIVKSADGLGPTEVIKASRIPEDRVVTILVGLYPDYAVETAASLRQALYRVLSPWVNTDLKFQLMNGVGVVGEVDAHVTKLEIAPFSKDPAVQITLECAPGKPYFSDPMQFVMWPELTGTKFTVENLGTAPTGATFEFVLNAAASSFALYRGGAGVAPKMEMTYAFLSGDKIQFDTTFGTRYIRVDRAGVKTNLLHVLNADVVWHQLHQGDNDFWVSTTAMSTFSVIHRPMYQGV